MGFGSIREAFFVRREMSLQEGDSGKIQAVVSASDQFVFVSNTCFEIIAHNHADGSSTLIVPRPDAGGTILLGGGEQRSLTLVAKLHSQMAKDDPRFLSTHAFDILKVT
ncbi:hypothetical protein EYZ11_006657 [Aspergillus tanneri]|uniref:Uncharacterized protein n=1 Tax=Aspergillus tanneri TaxID=1220188 RepID=A0A4S3JFG6_9EURO|nr:hypothetical protein EYZ11_006657 [Aspergillus tanneri]